MDVCEVRQSTMSYDCWICPKSCRHCFISIFSNRQSPFSFEICSIVILLIVACINICQKCFCLLQPDTVVSYFLSNGILIVFLQLFTAVCSTTYFYVFYKGMLYSLSLCFGNLYAHLGTWVLFFYP